MGWREDRSWKVVFPEQHVFLLREHNWGFIAWEHALEQGWTTRNATVFQLDNHMDDAYDGAIVPGVIEAKSARELYPLTREVLGHQKIVGMDNYLFAAFARETIQKVVYVCPKHKSVKDREPLDLSRWEEKDIASLQSALPEGRLELYRGKHLLSIEDLQKYEQDEGYLPYLDGQSRADHSVILSIDFDIFTEYLEMVKEPGDVKLKDEETIREQMRYIKNAYQWDVITVALSPWYVGGEENAEIILRLFLEEFGLNLGQAQDWSVLQ
ncbi:UPF0489 family protein [Ectobacillus ponti]|uniref:UPF0489 family protein n=1 Tax=Ectobacillus ponti TaxID=2961894 RepID=A0AA41X9K2_9BACI|nr:UPF0489 family protein [Ectobacillus ponti]MCP8969199.1 UPF0489 family protein [Ectobacillus ponti]